MREQLDFLLFDWLKVGPFCARPRFAEHSRETFTAVLDTCERIARERFAPLNRLVDAQEPQFDGQQVRLPEGVGAALAPMLSPACWPLRRTWMPAARSCPAPSKWRAMPSSARPAWGLSAYAMLTSATPIC